MYVVKTLRKQFKKNNEVGYYFDERKSSRKRNLVF